jgi:Phosphotransferase enzyme family
LNVPVTDPFGVSRDPAMPFLAAALDPREAEPRLARAAAAGRVRLGAIRVTRYKPGRRCLIEYDLEVEQPGGACSPVTWVGKARAKGLDLFSCQLLGSLRGAGFGAESTDGISVPEPVGVIAEWQMWLQHKAPGVAATQLLAEPGGVALAERIAEAAHKLHRAGIAPRRRHTMADELRILHERLPALARERPHWARRLERLLDACDRLGAATAPGAFRGVHRDFYADHVLVDGPRLYLLDFDLYCEGDPGLDIGNFLGHLTEQSLRTLGGPDAMADREGALEERFVELAGAGVRAAVRAYALLTLVRHVALSTQLPERRPFTATLLEVCEQRLCRYARGTPALEDRATGRAATAT